MAQVGASQLELRAEWLVRSALGHIRILEDLDFYDTKVSLKAFEVPVLVEAYRRFALLDNDYPLHVGVTEAGTPRAGSVRSAVGIGTVLAMGIGDTIRVSLTTDPKEEVFVGYEILKSLELRQKGATKDADVGIAAGAGKGKNVLEADMLDELTKKIHAVIEDRKNGIFDEPEDLAAAYRPMIPLVQV